jgi:arylsulfatase A-like enzyme
MKFILPLCFILVCSLSYSQRSPNFIVILTDDQRYDALRANGNEAIYTPNLDKFFQKGIRFTNAHVVFALCSPSRAAIMTGRYGSANGVLELDSKLNPGEKTVANYLKAQGYYTGVSGKWHVDQSPQQLGFDFATTFYSNGTYHGRTINDQGTMVKPKEHCDAYCARRSLDFLDKAVAKNQPFFLFHNTQLPHMDHRMEWPAQDSTRALYDVQKMPVAANKDDDLSTKPDYLKSVRNLTQARVYGYPDKEKIQEHTLDYYSVITEMDAFLGSILNKVDQLGIAEHTYLIFMSDNGWMLGDHGFTSKVLPYQSSTRVPMCIVGPGIEPSISKGLVLNIDIAPTLLELAGIKIPSNVHGKSLKPMLTGRKQHNRDYFVYEGLGSYGGAKPNLTVVSDKYRYIVTYENEKLDKVNYRELYDIKKDPNEMQNMALDSKYKSLLKGYNIAIDRHRKAIVHSARSTDN